MSSNWYSNWTGESNGNSSSCFNNNYNQSDSCEYEYGNSGGFNPAVTIDYSARSNYGENYSHSFRGGYDQRYRDNGSSNDRSNYRGNYGQIYGENARSNYRSNYCDNFLRGFHPSFGDNARGNYLGINYTGNNRERYYCHERRTGSDWTGHYYNKDRTDGSDEQNKVEESCLKKSIQDCLLEGSIVVVKQQRGRHLGPKYQCLHCKTMFVNEEHIQKKGHLRHVEHCIDVRACYAAPIGKRKLSSHTSEGLEFKKVKMEPYQNPHEEDYIEKDIKDESEKIKQKVNEESFEKDLRIKQEVKLEKDCTQELTGGSFKVNNFKEMVMKGKVKYFKNQIKDNVEQNEDMPSQERVQNYVTNQIKEEIVIKKEMTREEIFENVKSLKMTSQDQEQLKSDDVNHITQEEATNFATKQAQEKRKRKQENKKKEKGQYACLNHNCLETFKVWGHALSHMQQCCFTIRPMLRKSRRKAEMQKRVAVVKRLTCRKE